MNHEIPCIDEPAKAQCAPSCSTGRSDVIRALDLPRTGMTKARTPAAGQDAEPPAEERLICAECSNPITSKADRISVAGAHRHTFANPHGIVYQIGCFAAAPGCARTGAQSSAFTWFAGYSWQVVICGRCAAHLGWGFYSSDHIFVGLILDKLVEENRGSGP